MNLVAKSESKHLVYGEVYAPQRPDSDREYMTCEWIEKAAHDFVRSGRMDQIDVMHNNIVVKGCHVVESFVAREDDNVFIPGSWVIGVHIPDKTLWDQIEKGEINGFSMEALVSRHEQQVQISIPPVVTGLTSKTEDHEHHFSVIYDSEGTFKGGMTDVVNGHAHSIVAGTHTQTTEGHNHRFSAVDNVEILVEA